jgi:hypothetical protein
MHCLSQPYDETAVESTVTSNIHQVGKIVAFYFYVDYVWNVMAHAQQPDFVFRRNGRVHLNRRERQFSRLLAAEVCASALVMLDTPRSEVVWEYWLHTPFASFPFTSPPVRHRVPSGFKGTLLRLRLLVVKWLAHWSSLRSSAMTLKTWMGSFTGVLISL